MIIAINGVYALALDGKFSKAMAHLSRMRKNNEEECKMYVHWSLCHACVQFDSFFFAGNILVAERKCLDRIHCHSPAEADFRRAIVAVWAGVADEELLEAMDARLEYLQELGDRMLRIRGLMVAALVQTDWDKSSTGARSLLVEALKLCDSTDLAYTRATVLRRLAVADLLDGELSAAENHLAECHYLLTKKNSYRFEKAMYHLTKFALVAMRRAKGPVDASSTETISDLLTAKQLFEEGEFALFLKLASYQTNDE
ncbi:GFI-3 protein [Aphelenchoides avenae]|nr:GFI-3 protein [Aphelenchus avenae]